MLAFIFLAQVPPRRGLLPYVVCPQVSFIWVLTPFFKNSKFEIFPLPSVVCPLTLCPMPHTPPRLARPPMRVYPDPVEGVEELDSSADVNN